MTFVRFGNVFPTSSVEELFVVAPNWVREVDFEVLLCLVDLVHCDHRPHHVPLQEVLQAEEADLFIGSTAALEVRIHLCGARWILQMMSHLVGVCQHDDVVEGAARNSLRYPC